MLTNYLKVAWRTLARNKIFSSINIFGLSLGLTCSLLIMLWVVDEKNIDAFHANGKYLYQVYERSYYDGKIVADYPTQGLLAQELKRAIPEIQYTSGLENVAAPGASSTFEAGKKINKMNGCFAGEDFFSMFSYPLLQGRAATALSSISSIAISREMAEYFFGGPEKAIGKPIRFENKEDLMVTAVFDNVANSSRKFDFLRSWAAFVRDNGWVNNWGNTDPSTFIQLRKDADPIKVENEIKDFIYRYQSKEKGFYSELAMQPYSEQYLHASFKNGKVDGGRIEYVRLFTAVAIFILFIACINFMNLATARSSKRAKEVGMRKVIGAPRISLIAQFIGEAMLLTCLAIIIALVLSVLLLPAFNNLTAKQLTMPVSKPVFWAAIAGLLVVTGFVAGSYPALFLSSLKPLRVLKGSLKFSWGATFFRQALVVFQFALSIMLIVGMIVIYRQMEFIQTKNLGYDRDNLLYIPIEGELVKQYGLFKDEVSKMPGIVNISKMRNTPTMIGHHTGSISWPGKQADLTVSFADEVVGYDFAKTMGLTMQAGRDFSKNYPTDSLGFLVNETAVQRMGYTNPIGQTVIWGNHEGKIIGVMKDFHFNSMHHVIDPLIVHLDDKCPWGNILVRIKAGKTKEAIAGLEKTYKEINPKFPFTYKFSDQEYDKLYRSEQVVSKLFNYFAFLAILISCLGLFGLAAFTATQRTREIGIRKVIGASVPDIFVLLSGNFLKLIIIAILISFPLAWYGMNQWLQNFIYKIHIEWWMFALAGTLTFLIALLTISYQSIQSATSNPVKSLRTE